MSVFFNLFLGLIIDLIRLLKDQRLRLGFWPYDLRVFQTILTLNLFKLGSVTLKAVLIDLFDILVRPEDRLGFSIFDFFYQILEAI